MMFHSLGTSLALSGLLAFCCLRVGHANFRQEFPHGVMQHRRLKISASFSECAFGFLNTRCVQNRDRSHNPLLFGAHSNAVSSQPKLKQIISKPNHHTNRFFFHREFALQNSPESNENSSSSNEKDFSWAETSSNNFYNDLEDLFPENDDVNINIGNNQSPPLSPSMEMLQPPQEQQQNQEKSQPPPPPTTISDESLLSSLQKRQTQLQKSSSQLLQKWRTGIAKTFVGFTINEHFYLPKSELGYLLSNNNNDGSSSGGSGGNGYRKSTSGSISGSGNAQELPFDWVRRVSIGSYPRVACGSAHGSIYVADVELGRLLGVARSVHSNSYGSDQRPSQQRNQQPLSDGMHERLRQWLYGDFDGGGVLAVDMYGMNFVASSGREGGVKLFKFVEKAKGGGGGVLECLGSVPTLARPLPGTIPTLVTCLKFDSLGRLFIGGADGYLRMVTFPEYFGVGGVGKGSEMEMKVTVVSSTGSNPSPILSMDISEDILRTSTMVATCHANGNVEVHSISHDHDEEVRSGVSYLGKWSPFSTNEGKAPSHARSVAFVSRYNNVEVDVQQFALIVGGGNGEMWVCDLETTAISQSTAALDALDTTATSKPLSNHSPFIQHETTRKINPLHNGPVLALATRPGGIVISTAHDGLLRVSQVWNDEDADNGKGEASPKSLYGLMGYKVWIGNICIDDEGKRLISDGRDDVVVVHDFSKDPSEDEGDDGREET